MLHISTDYVFDRTKQGAYTEDDPVAPVGVYGRTKADGDVAVRRAARRYVILRTSWVYGRYGGDFLKMTLRLAGERDRLRVVADPRGCPTAPCQLGARFEPLRGDVRLSCQGWRERTDEIVVKLLDRAVREPA